MIITRRIEIYVAAEDKEIKNQQWSRLREIDRVIYQAANRIVSEQYMNEVIENRLVMKDGRVIEIDSEIRKQYRKKNNKDEEVRKITTQEIERLKESKKSVLTEAKQYYALGKKGGSKQNSTYQIISRDYPNVPSSILAALNISVTKTLTKEMKEVRKGARSLRTYRFGMPIPFQFKDNPFEVEEDGNISFKWESGITFRIYFGRDRSSNRTIVERIISGEYKASDSSIQLKDNKVYLLLCVTIPDKVNEAPDPNLFVGVDLGVNTPVSCALSQGYERVSIGNKNDLFNWRTRLRVRRRQLQTNLRETTGGKGRKKRLKALDRFEEAERNYVKTYNHTLSKGIISFTKKHNASAIKMELLEGYGKDKNGKLLKGDYILSRWSYYELQTMIAYKAKMEGITVVYIDPYHTSQTCSLCGHYEAGQRETQDKFICKNSKCKSYDQEVNADYNAAVNIARSTNIVTKKEECEYYRLRHSAET